MDTEGSILIENYEIMVVSLLALNAVATLGVFFELYCRRKPKIYTEKVIAPCFEGTKQVEVTPVENENLEINDVIKRTIVRKKK